MKQPIPENVVYVIAALKEKGVESWVIGGAVRDHLLSREVHDWDVTAAGTPEQIAAALPDAKPIGGVFGTVTWHGVEITPCRAECDYTDHRHPDVITFGTDLKVDLSRRDFTVNAMAWDGTATIVDPYRGRYDLKDRVLRAVGDPNVRFEEDALRILRLYRFAGVLGFAIEPATGAAALAHSDTLRCVSVPRIRGELDKALKGSHPSALAPLIAVDGLAPFAIDGAFLMQGAAHVVEAAACAGGADAACGNASDSVCADAEGAGAVAAVAACIAQAQGVLAPLDTVPQSLLCRWWALLHLTQSNAYKAAKIFDFGKSFVKDFAKLDELFAAGMPEDLHALKLQLSGGLAFPFLDVAETFAAVDARFAKLPLLYCALIASGEPYLKEHLAITPAALMAMGVRGRKVGELQRCLLKAAIDTPSMNKEKMLVDLAHELKDLV